MFWSQGAYSTVHGLCQVVDSKTHELHMLWTVPCLTGICGVIGPHILCCVSVLVFSTSHQSLTGNVPSLCETTMLRRGGLKQPQAPAGTSVLGQVAPLCSLGLRTQSRLPQMALPTGSLRNPANSGVAEVTRF